MNSLLIEKREYKVIGILQNEVKVIKSFENYLSGEIYINSAVHVIAEKNIPLSYYDVWLNAKDIEEYIEEAMKRELLDPNADNFNLVDMFRSGYLLYYQNLLIENLDAMVFNKIIVRVNDLLNTFTEEELEQIAIEEIESELITITENYDSNKKLSDIEKETEKMIVRIKSWEFERKDSNENPVV